MSERVSVHICTRNRPEYLSVLLSSLYKQTFKDFDVIIVDDFSDKPIFQEKILMDWIQKLRNSKHAVKVIRNPARLFIGKSRNIAIKNDTNEICCRIDDDSFCEPDYLMKLYLGLNGDRKIAGVGGIVPYLGRVPYYRNTDKLNWFNETVGTIKGKILSCADDGHFHWHPAKTIRSHHLRSSFMFRKKPVINVGMHAEEYGCTGYREETDLCFRLLAVGYELFTVTDAIAWHLVALGGGRDLAGRNYNEMTQANDKHFNEKMKPIVEKLVKKGVFVNGEKNQAENN